MSRPVLGSVAAGAVVVVPEADVPAVPEEPAEPEPLDDEPPPEVCGAGVSGSTSPPLFDEPELPSRRVVVAVARPGVAVPEGVRVLLVARALGERGRDRTRPHPQAGNGEQHDDPAANGRHATTF